MRLASHRSTSSGRSASARQRQKRSKRCDLTLEQLEKRELLATSVPLPLHLDFGSSTSPVAFGDIGVPVAGYSSTRGYGWLSTTGISAVDRGTSNPLTRDFHQGHDSTFLVDLAPGTYNVTLTLGDAKDDRSNIAVWIEGTQVASGISTLPGQFLQRTFQVQVNDGQLTLRIAGLGSSTNAFALDALDIAAVTTVPPAALTASAGSYLTTAEGTPVQFRGAVSGGVGPYTYSWNFGDGTTGSGTIAPIHAYADNGIYTVTFTVTDSASHSASATSQLTITNVAPSIVLNGPYRATTGSSISFAAIVKDPSSVDTAAGFTYSWNF